MVTVDKEQERKEWELRFIKRLRSGGMGSVEAHALFNEIYGWHGKNINLTATMPEEAAQRLLLRRLSGKA
jgi:uncharacterized heparinase superfamily protein